MNSIRSARPRSQGVALLCLFALGALGCRGSPSAGEAARADGGAVAASYTGGEVTREDVARELTRLPPALRQSFQSRAGRLELARSLVDKRLLVGEARRRGFDAQPEIRRQVAELEERLIVQALLAEEEKRAGPPSDAELRAYYESHGREFEQPERVRVSRVLARVSKEAPRLEQAKAKERAARWIARLRRGEPFTALVEEGDGPERTRSGDLGFLARGGPESAELIEAAFALKAPGDTSGVVACPEGFAVLRLAERRERRIPPLEEVRSGVEGRIAPGRKRKVFDDLLGRLRAGADVRVPTESE